MASRTIEYKIAAIDNATGVFQRAAQNIKTIAKTTETVEFAPIRKTSRSSDEQATRNEVAARIKASRLAVRQAAIQRAADERLFGQTVAASINQATNTIQQASARQATASTAPRGRGTANAGGIIPGIAGFNDDAGKTIKAVGKMFVVIQAADLAIKGLSAAFSGSRNAAMDFFQAFADIPILGQGFTLLADGIAKVGQAFGADIKTFTQAKAELEQFNQALQDNLRLRAEQNGAIRDLGRQAAMIGKSDFEKDVLGAQNRFDDEMGKLIKQQRDLQQQAESGVSVGSTEFENIDKQKAFAKQIFDDEVRQANERRDKQRQAESEQRQRAARAEEDLAVQHAERMRQIKEDMAVASLEAAGKTAEAERLKLQQGFDRQVREAEEKFRQLKGVSGVSMNSLVAGEAGLKSEKEFIESERQRALEADARKRDEQSAKSQQSIDERLKAARISALEMEGKLGNKNAEMEAERLRIAEEYASRRRDILELLKEEAITDEQRVQALRELAGLDQLEAASLINSRRRRQEDFRPQNARAESGRNIATSFAGPQGISVEQQQLKKQEETVKKLDINNQLMQQLITYLRLNPGALSSF